MTAEEIRLRGLLLAKHKDLLQIHRDLVMSGMVTEEEFWESRKGLLESQAMLLRQQRPPTASQLIGPEVKSQTASDTASSDLKFILTPTLIQTILNQNPIVKRAYEEKVPAVLDEKAFWMQYFTSKFFKESLAAGSQSVAAVSGSASATGNILDEYYFEAQQAEIETMRPAEELPLSIDIEATEEDHFKALDPNTKLSDQTSHKEGRSRSLLIRKLNKLSLGIVESSGMNRSGTVEEALPELFKPETVVITGSFQSLEELRKRKPVTVNHDVVLKLLQELKDNYQAGSAPKLVSYQEYCLLMKPFVTSSPSTTTDSENLNYDDKALQTIAVNLQEVLRQFWSVLPQAKSPVEWERLGKLVDVMGTFRGKLDQFLAQMKEEAERKRVRSMFDPVIKAVDMATSKLTEGKTQQSATKRPKTK